MKTIIFALSFLSAGTGAFAQDDFRAKLQSLDQSLRDIRAILELAGVPRPGLGVELRGPLSSRITGVTDWGPAAKAGIVAGDEIEMVNDIAIRDAQGPEDEPVDAHRLIVQAGDRVRLFIKSADGSRRWVELRKESIVVVPGQIKDLFLDRYEQLAARAEQFASWAEGIETPTPEAFRKLEELDFAVFALSFDIKDELEKFRKASAPKPI